MAAQSKDYSQKYLSRAVVSENIGEISIRNGAGKQNKISHDEERRSPIGFVDRKKIGI